MGSTVSTHSSLTPVSTYKASVPVGPYSQGIQVGNLLFCSGCMARDFTLDVVAQTEQALQNLKDVVEAGVSELGKVAKTTIFLKDMNDLVAVNDVYAKIFGDHAPTCSVIEAARLPGDALVEIECIASCLLESD